MNSTIFFFFSQKSRIMRCRIIRYMELFPWAFLVEDFLHFFFFFWRARVEDYPPRGFIVGVTLSPPREPIFSRACMPSRAAPLKKICLRRHFHFLLLKKCVR